MNISNRIKHVLIDQNLTPSDLARKTGYTPQYIIDVLKGNRRWNETTIEKACDALGLEFELVPKSK
ncbi:helix-turn-helix domain-containing protein [Paenibacillus sp. RS8]|jgi:transcriptional regulator with XRE-family HTH domain|uniref:helix-turn-helix domain-containing protein n=1 Tax=Paenibacillus sp. RS8 TaxID=3242681 RepID=UPI00338C0EED